MRITRRAVPLPRRTAGRRSTRPCLGLAVLSLLALAGVAGCGGRTGRGDDVTLPQDVAAVRTVVALGDSVVTGSTCDCAPFPELVGRGLGERLARTVTVSNRGVDGSTASDLRRSLETDPGLRSDVAEADLVLVTAGANDLAPLSARYAPGRTCDAGCVAAVVDPAAQSVEDVVRHVRALTPAARIVVTDYWNVFAESTDPQRRAYDRNVTRAFGDAVRREVTSPGATVVGLEPPFATPSGGPLLLSDGDHPSAAGHERIAETILAALGVGPPS